MTSRACSHLGWEHPDFDHERHRVDMLAEAERLAGDPDWRVREWVAWQVRRQIPRRVEAADTQPDERWTRLHARMSIDPHPHVRAASRIGPPGSILEDRLRQQAALELFASGVPMPDDEILGWRSDERLAIARLTQGQVPAALLDDPDCEIRAAAVGRVAAAAFDGPTLARLRADPCLVVRGTTLDRFGPDPAIPLHELTEEQRIAAARTTSDPVILAVLAADPSVDVRLQVARNQHCPAHLLVDVARHPVVFGAALANPAWPAGVRPPDPFEPADH